MTIPKLAIERAIEGGWAESLTDFLNTNGDDLKSPQEIALDPSFWQSLGKVLVWEKMCDPYCRFENCVDCANWLPKAHRFYDLILTGGDTEKFWEELLSAKK